MKSKQLACVAGMAVCMVLAPLGVRAQVPGMTVDQADTPSGTQFVFNNYRTLWQSYTAGTNGFLGAVDVVIYSTDNVDWTATFSVYEGEGMAGRTLASQPVSGGGGVVYRTFLLDAPVRQTSGSRYSFAFANPSTGLSVRLYLNSYAGGRCSQNGSYDYRFHTYVITSDWSELAYRDTNFTASATVISNAAQLAQFAYLVNGGAQYFGKTVTLANDINLAGHFWTPICTNGTFAGTFDGNNKTIRSVTIDRPTVNKQGLFGYIGGTIRNVNVADVDITGHDDVGGLIADGFGVVANCSVSGAVSGHFNVGGVLGYGHGTMSGCTNRSTVTGYSYVGGVVGLGGNEALTGCRNEGSVSGSSQYAGGVMGSAQGDIIDCSNAGAVLCPGVINCGGIVGMTEHRVRNCRNSGSVSGGYTVGGIVGQGCEELARCVNTGSVTAGAAAGGIVGVLNQGFLWDCANHGSVEAATGAGGLAGAHEAYIRNSFNNGTVTGGRGVGGLMGISEVSGICVNCQNSGAVNGSEWVGALAGAGGEFSNCYWKQTGIAPFTLEAVGYAVVSLQDCRAFGSAPGTLATPVTLVGETGDAVTTTSLSSALNAFVVGNFSLFMGKSYHWTAGSGTAYPALADTRWSDPGNYSTNWYNAAATQFAIGTAEDLAGLAVLVNAGLRFTNQTVTLTADITLTDREWAPIGHTFSPAYNWFHGTFEGNGKTITGAWQDGDTMGRYDFAGLFGVLDAKATVRNLAVVDSQSVGATVAGGIAGYQLGTLRNCSSSVSAFSRENAGCLVGLNGENGSIHNCYARGFSYSDGASGFMAAINMGTISNCYWRHTVLFPGPFPISLPGVGSGNAIGQCSSFSNAPGTLATSVTVGGVTTNGLSAALNAWVASHGAGASGYYNWTAGTATRFPRLTPVIAVGGTPVPQALTEGFAVGASLAGTATAVASYTNAHPGTTATSFGEVLRLADAMGFSWAQLAAGNAILDFSPSLSIVGFDLTTRTLTFSVANGVDTTATAAMNRLAASEACLLRVLKSDQLGGGTTPLTPAVTFDGDATAHATVTLPAPPASAFFRLTLERQP